jgi:hypothetical protein
MGELGRFGAQLPHDEAAQREHFPCHRVSFRREQAVSENGAVECTHMYVERCPRITRGGAWHRHEERR